MTRIVYADTTRDHDNVAKVGIFTAITNSHQKTEVIRLTLEEAMQFRTTLESAIKKAERELDG